MILIFNLKEKVKNKWNKENKRQNILYQASCFGATSNIKKFKASIVFRLHDKKY